MTLEEIDGVFEGKIRPWRSGAVKSRFGEEVERVRRGQSLDMGEKGDKESVVMKESV